MSASPLTIQAGLCTRCVHARRIESSRGSGFLLCRYAALDPSFARYPALPVMHCRAFTEHLTQPSTSQPHDRQS